MSLPEMEMGNRQGQGHWFGYGRMVTRDWGSGFGVEKICMYL